MKAPRSTKAPTSTDRAIIYLSLTPGFLYLKQMRMAIIAKIRDNINPNPKVKGEVRSSIKEAIDRPFALSYF